MVSFQRRALRHEAISRHARLRIRPDKQVPSGDRIFCIGSGACFGDGSEIICSEPDHDLGFMAGATGASGDEGVVGDVCADRIGAVAVEIR